MRWSAPELILESDKTRVFSSKIDVYSFGMLMYELITKGSVPFEGYNN